jgi:hypothetical protein
MLAMMQGDTLLFTLRDGGWFFWPDGSAASPAQAGAAYKDYHLETYTPPEPTREEVRANMPVLERAQVLLALDAIEITEEMVDAALAGNRPGMIEWQNRLRFRRDHYLIDALGELFHLTPDQIDSLWLWAAEL